MMRKAFTLIEVNLAILVMAGGILSVIVLYSLGYRETRQSREDITSAAYSDSVLSPLIAALSSKTLTWEEFNALGDYPEATSVAGSKTSGWGAYLQEKNNSIVVIDNPTDKARSVFSDVMGAISTSGVSGGGLSASKELGAIGLVVSHTQNSGIVKIGFRASKKPDTLLSAPVYYTEVRFQGGFEEEGGQK